ncbi:MAG: O-antigen ligase family protein [Aquisalimonadaceae bacterium]
MLLVAWALIGPRRSIEALTLSWLLTFLNPGIYTEPIGGDVLRWLVVLAAFVSVSFCLFRTGFRMPRAWLGVVIFVIVSVILSIQTSYAPDVSLFKLTSFFIATTAVLGAFHLTKDQATYWQQWFLIVFSVVVVMSFPLIIHDLGFVRNGRGFQGLTNHPQAYAAFIAPFLAWVVAIGLQRQRFGIGLATVITLAGISLFATQGRTGVIAATAGLVLAGMWALMRRGREARLPRVWLAIGLVAFGVCVGVGAFQWSTIKESAVEFVMKDRQDYTVEEAFYGSRGFLIERSMNNFRENPLLGIGFGVASDPGAFRIRHDPLLGLPVGASVEKGFTVTAVLEEVGLIGFVFFLFMIAALLKPIFVPKRAFPELALALGAFLVNLGEGVFFAIGGIGLLIWLVIGAAQVMAKADPVRPVH